MGAKFSGDGDQPVTQSGDGSASDRSDMSVQPGEAGLDTIEITGAIKWFDAGKGFGFIVPDNGMADVLLHVTCLRRDGYQSGHGGARIAV